MKVARVQEMREMDRCAIENTGIPEIVLMENAGVAAVNALEANWGIPGRRFLVVCGQGNNGGDGFVCARQIISRNGKVRVIIVGEEERIRGAAAENLAILKRITDRVEFLSTLEALREALEEADIIIDALYGTGLSREIEGFSRQVIECINEAGKPVLSLDIPSGINGDTGAVMGVAVRASITVTFGLPKVGNLLYPGFAYGGKLFHSYISFPPSLYEGEGLSIAVNETVPLPPRDPAAHKGTMGDVLFISGASNYFGAPFLCAMSFLKAGGGYARLAAPKSIIGTIAALGPEIVFLPQEETKEGSLARANEGGLLAVASGCDFVVIGPGLSLVGETKGLVRELVRKIEKPVIIDGDGITAVAEDLSCIRDRKSPTCLTPHPGEMARITGLKVKDINSNRVEVLRQTVQELGAVIVLKGAHSLIGLPDGRIFINLTGNPGMATAGSGDVLTGTIAAMAGLGLPWEEAIKKGVFIHGRAGDLAAQHLGEDGVTARGILDYLPLALKEARVPAPGLHLAGKISSV